MIGYKRWLVNNFLGSPNALGRLADFADLDKGFPGGAAKKETIANYLQKSTLPEECLEAFEASWEIYNSAARKWFYLS